MKKMLQSEEELAKIKDLIKLVCILFKIVVLKPVYFEHILSLTKKTRVKVRFYRTLHAISSNF
jgi:type III secretory pathway component EscS